MDVLLDRRGRSAFRAIREYDLNAGDVTALSFSGDGNELTASGLSGKVVALGPKRGGTVRPKAPRGAHGVGDGARGAHSRARAAAAAARDPPRCTGSSSTRTR